MVNVNWCVSEQFQIEDVDNWKELVELITNESAPEDWPIVPDDSLKLPDAESEGEV